VNLNPSFLTIYVGDTHEDIFLRDSVTGCSRAHDTFSRFGSTDVDFHFLFQQLAAVLLLPADTARAGHHESVALSTSPSQVTSTFSVSNIRTSPLVVVDRAQYFLHVGLPIAQIFGQNGPLIQNTGVAGAWDILLFTALCEQALLAMLSARECGILATGTVPWLKPYISWLWILILDRRWNMNCYPYL
jgi:hypothetical protein